MTAAAFVALDLLDTSPSGIGDQPFCHYVDEGFLNFLRHSVFYEALSEKMAEHDETIEDLTEIIKWQPPFATNKGGHYSELVIATPKWIYACRNNSGEIDVSTIINPDILKPENVLSEFDVMSVISGRMPYRIVRTSTEDFSMEEKQGYKRLVPLYRQNDGEVPTLVGTAWVHYNSNDSVVDKKRRLKSIEMLGLKIDDKDEHYEFWQGVLDTEGKTVDKTGIPETILDGLYWA